MTSRKTFDLMTLEEIQETIEKINNKTLDVQTASERYFLSFTLSTDGEYSYCQIKVSNIVLWDSEEEGRRWVDDNNQEPLINCLWRRLSYYIDSLRDMREAMEVLKEENND